MLSTILVTVCLSSVPASLAVESDCDADTPFQVQNTSGTIDFNGTLNHEDALKDHCTWIFPPQPNSSFALLLILESLEFKNIINGTQWSPNGCLRLPLGFQWCTRGDIPACSFFLSRGGLDNCDVPKLKEMALKDPMCSSIPTPTMNLDEIPQIDLYPGYFHQDTQNLTGSVKVRYTIYDCPPSPTGQPTAATEIVTTTSSATSQSEALKALFIAVLALLAMLCNTPSALVDEFPSKTKAAGRTGDDGEENEAVHCSTYFRLCKGLDGDRVVQ